MRKILLTSAGFENINIQNKFIELINKNPKDIKALFITTAAVEPDAILMLPKCLNDLLNCKIPKGNVTVYDMHKPIGSDKLMKYDVVYVCGGNTRYLLNRMVEVEFNKVINSYIDNGGCYIGVSAGSIAASGKYENSLDFIKNVIDVHCKVGDPAGIIKKDSIVNLTNSQAILITDDELRVIE
jgi:dipeptidase E